MNGSKPGVPPSSWPGILVPRDEVPLRRERPSRSTLLSSQT